MHPIMMLMNATLGPSVRRMVSAALTAAVVLAVPAVAVALLLPGSFTTASSLPDPRLAGMPATPDRQEAVNGLPTSQADEQTQVRLQEWTYTAKPISGAKIRKKK